MSWKKGWFKENVKCSVCGKRLPALFKVCDDCVLEIYLETVLTTKTLSEIAKEVGVNVKTLSWRINRMKNRSDFPEKFDRAYRKYLQKISHNMVYGDH